MYTQQLNKDDISLHSNTLHIKVDVSKAQNMINGLKDKKYVIEIRESKEKRSLAANNMCWTLCTQLAVVMKTGKDEMYLQQLKKYGVSSRYTVWEEALEPLVRNLKYYELDKARFHNGRGVVDVTIYVGSSEYNTKEMSNLISGIIDDCKEQGIDVIQKEELDSLIKSWGGIK